MKKSWNVIRCYLFIVFALTAFIVGKNTCSNTDSSDTVLIERTDTLYIEHTDTLPPEKGETITKYVKIPVYTHNTDTVTVTDSLEMQVVQKLYSDDSTYTAYVSGIKYNDLPKMDSIITRQRTITNTIRETITVTKNDSRWHIGLQGGYGYGLAYKGFEPYIGIGVEYSLFPP